MTRTLAEAKHEGSQDVSPGSLADMFDGFLAQIQVLLGNTSRDHLSAAERDRRELNQVVYPVSFSAIGTVTAGGLLSIAQAELLGPRTGWLWDVGRVSVFGLHASTEVVQLFKSPTAATAGQAPQNLVCTLVPAANQVTGSFGAFQTFGKGQCVLRAGESLQVGVASGLTSGEVVTFSGDAMSIAMPFAGEYYV